MINIKSFTLSKSDAWSVRVEGDGFPSESAANAFREWLFEQITANKVEIERRCEVFPTLN